MVVAGTSNVKSNAQSGVNIRIESGADIVTARHAGRMLAERAGLAPGEHTLIVTAIHELARNIVQYAKRGEIRVQIVNDTHEHVGISIMAFDNGPGIMDTDRVTRGGYSTSRGLGMGLVGIKHIMDDFHLHSAPGLGTRVTVTKWHQ